MDSMEQLYERGKWDRRRGFPMFYGAHIGMRSTREACKAEYERGWLDEDRAMRVSDEKSQ